VRELMRCSTQPDSSLLLLALRRLVPLPVLVLLLAVPGRRPPIENCCTYNSSVLGRLLMW
jgi:hypothetical protein